MAKIYVGNGKEKKFDAGGSIIAVTLNLDQLIKEYNEHGYVNNKNERMIRIDVGTRREVGQYGDTHTVTLSTWHPNDFMRPPAIEVSKKQAPVVEEQDPVF